MPDSDTHHKLQAKPQQEYLGRSLHHGEYQIKAMLSQDVFLASHMTLDLPLVLKQIRAGRSLSEARIAEVDRILHNVSSSGKDATVASGLHEQDVLRGDDADTDRFLQEAFLLASLHHPSIPDLYDHFFEDGCWYLAMEFIAGQSLADYLRQHAPLSTREALNYALQLCDVLDYLHTQTPPLIFCGLQPSKVMLTPSGRVMLMGFSSTRRGVQRNDVVQKGFPVSSYAPPEQYMAGALIDARSDLFSLGVMLHEMISGLSPVKLAGAEGTAGRLESLRQVNPALSPVLSGLVNIATQPDPACRFQSARNFYRALMRIYTLEERRAYQQGILTLEEADRLQHVSTPLPAVMDEAPPQSAAGEPQVIQLDSIDERLKERAFGVVAPTPKLILPGPEECMTPPPASHSGRGTRKVGRRIVYTCFVLALLLSLVMSALLVYEHRLRDTSIIAGSTPLATGVTTPAAPQPTGSWHVLPSLPVPQADNAAAYVQMRGKGYVYVSGGYHGRGYGPLYDHNLYRYDITAAHWQVAANGNFPAMVNDAVAVDEQGRLFFAAGYSPDAYAVASVLYMYQPDNGALQKIIPPHGVAIGFGMAMLADQQGHLYISQGFMKPGDPQVRAGTGWYRYDIASGQWHILAPLPIGVGYATLATDEEGRILMLGGAVDAGQHLPSMRMYRYDPIDNVWGQEPAQAPRGFSGAASCVDGHGHMMIAGGSSGFDGTTERVLNQSWLVDLQTLRWQSLATLPGGGSLLGTAACDGNGHMFLVRGANDTGRPTADFLMLSVNS